MAAALFFSAVALAAVFRDCTFLGVNLGGRPTTALNVSDFRARFPDLSTLGFINLPAGPNTAPNAPISRARFPYLVTAFFTEREVTAFSIEREGTVALMVLARAPLDDIYLVKGDFGGRGLLFLFGVGVRLTAMKEPPMNNYKFTGRGCGQKGWNMRWSKKPHPYIKYSIEPIIPTVS